MIREDANPWQQKGARSAMRASRPDRFIDQHVSPLFFGRTNGGPRVRDCKDIMSEDQFWGEGSSVILGAVRLNGFTLTDWFPRAPGVYWSEYAREARENTYSQGSNSDAELGRYYSPESKMGLIEEGGIGAIRLRPRRIDNQDCWLATAMTGMVCHRGIPLAIPDIVLREAGVGWEIESMLWDVSDSSRMLVSWTLQPASTMRAP